MRGSLLEGLLRKSTTEDHILLHSKKVSFNKTPLLVTAFYIPLIRRNAQIQIMDKKKRNADKPKNKYIELLRDISSALFFLFELCFLKEIKPQIISTHTRIFPINNSAAANIINDQRTKGECLTNDLIPNPIAKLTNG